MSRLAQQSHTNLMNRPTQVLDLPVGDTPDWETGNSLQEGVELKGVAERCASRLSSVVCLLRFTQFCNITVLETMSDCSLSSITNAYHRELQQGKGGSGHRFQSFRLAQEEGSNPRSYPRLTHCTTEEDVLWKSAPIYFRILLYSKFTIIQYMYRSHLRPRLCISRHRQARGS